MRFAVPPVNPSHGSRRPPVGRVGVIRNTSRRVAVPLAWLLLALSGARSPAQAPPQPFLPTPQTRGFFFFRLPQRSVAQVIPPQEGPNISARLMERATPENTSVIVSLAKQRVYLMCDNEVVIDSPISSGRKGHPTPPGNFHIREKALAHFSNIYGNFVDREGRVVRSGVSALIDSAPSGTHFEGAPMRFFMRLSDEGVGMHIGILPGYPASHGCVRLPAEIAPLIYGKVRVGTLVQVQE
jgi:lipoprotein-anchoring transpeptidase ErfK/SrfK